MTQLAKEAAKLWSSTLRLPKSSFPPRATTADLSKYLQRCTDDLYVWQEKERAHQVPFVLHDGPPYANGDLHVGHALNKIVKDIINRTNLQLGKRIHYVPGWDCHGLPIEQKAFEHHGWNIDKKPNAVQVRKAAASFARSAVEKQMAGFRSWGIMGAWESHWETMDVSFELRQLQIFRAMAAHGMIYRRNKPVYWSPSSRTALAEAELEYNEEHLSKAAVVKFRLNHSALQTELPISLVVWTTTPWTLPANQAIAIHRNLSYVIVDSANHGKLLLAKTRLEAVESMLSEKLHVTETSVNVEDLLRSSYQGINSFERSKRPIIHAEFVSDDAGTGLVHCAPGHGMEDYEALQPLIQSGIVQVKAPIDEEGKFTVDASPDNPGLLFGKSVLSEGNASVIDILRSGGSLLALSDYKHKYPYDWRTKQPIILRATPQWFADLGGIKDSSLKALDNVDFRPESGEARLRSFVANRSEWCISRQRSWGVPIPALYDIDTGAAFLSEESISHILSTIRIRGTDAWWSDAPHEPAWIAPGLNPLQFTRGTDTMDVWFDSGTSWSYFLRSDDTNLAQGAPADIYFEGSDQHRGWFQSSLLTYVADQTARADLKPVAPFKQLLTHGFTLDGAGKKMSKSVGNVITPEQIITGQIRLSDKSASEVVSKRSSAMRKSATASKPRGHAASPLGPDALRLWVASSDWTKDVTVSGAIVNTVHSSLHKYRVTFKLLLGALADYRPDDPMISMEHRYLAKLDRVALLQLHQVSSTVRQAFDNYEYHKAVTAINKWINSHLSGFYIEAIKDTLYCTEVSSERRRSAQITLFNILVQMQAMLASLTPMLVEESWEHSPDSVKVNQTHPLRRTWTELPSEWNDERLAEEYVPIVMAINAACKTVQERARSEKRMGSSLESECVVHLPGINDLKTCLVDGFTSELSAQLKEILVVSQLTALDVGLEAPSSVSDSEGLRVWAEAAQSKTSEVWRTWRQANSSPAWSYVQPFSFPSGSEHAQTAGFVAIYPPIDMKCPRCWHYNVMAKEESGVDEALPVAHKELCGRCRHAVAEGSRSDSRSPQH